ncbi:hypothetical protein K469DRAFT_686999 [Zopfia rhizophila CBS 207.26]|uniref:Deoxyribonuclease NucA/NucB domain-containing protein n=1 Tax=Zopfia rhizophila CBS 207.26 TaxID=1314779 RepID=A0A6A6E801_9PEZI|nr:hypothetical protein K469DRAFT_686999 [Zopfia rhizophila CBS 207.26]
MCWGVHCTSGKFSSALTLSRSNQAKRRRTAGCTVPKSAASNPTGQNRCRVPGQTFGTRANGKPSHNCDEFPFASTAEADAGGQINRCVPEEQNSGNSIKNFYRGRVTGDKFQIAFASPSTAGVTFCVNPAGGNVCVNDGNIFLGVQGPVSNPTSFTPKRSNEAFVPKNRMFLYRTKLGREVSSPALFEPGRLIHVYVARNASAPDEVELEMDEIHEMY